MKKYISILFVLGLLALLLGPANLQTQSSAAKKYTIATVVKLSGVQWFNRMEEGVKKFGKDTGNETFQQGPPKADAALQVQIIEDLIAQHVNAICVVPISSEALEPVLKKAMDQGIVVISHEASNIKNVNYDIEAFDNSAYGAHLMDQLANSMGKKGEYAIFVGSLTAKTHNEWADAAIARQKKLYPHMKLVTDRLESNEDQTVAYNKTKELLKKYPNLKGIQGSAATDPAGAGLAVEELGLQGKVSVVGTSLVSVSSKYLKSGATDVISFWDPADAGYAMNKLALTILEGKKIKAGANLGIPGYNQVKIKGKVIYGQAWIDVTKENMSKYNF
ncbi:simple sugar transport system substrate-binding protein [Hydrogenispora ethanolica]|uniref:Simple sugar transport system substrate-binding protein n=1 Tax=Hydrogenispora ethanolica TaxID=1082276 RepID=A0A4R1R8H0_HYDET|nr:autoinducer 2 ABC transporter substrate-binding protein [Hydrogenispora ethanolica]TCL61953.1 simple sugar transport system substrate-binding protein [Hydrogenispora ethanolica]